jgi:hypothetical protein
MAYVSPFKSFVKPRPLGESIRDNMDPQLYRQIYNVAEAAPYQETEADRLRKARYAQEGRSAPTLPVAETAPKWNDASLKVVSPGESYRPMMESVTIPRAFTDVPSDQSAPSADALRAIRTNVPRVVMPQFAPGVDQNTQARSAYTVRPMTPTAVVPTGLNTLGLRGQIPKEQFTPQSAPVRPISESIANAQAALDRAHKFDSLQQAVTETRARGFDTNNEMVVDANGGYAFGSTPRGIAPWSQHQRPVSAQSQPITPQLAATPALPATTAPGVGKAPVSPLHLFEQAAKRDKNASVQLQMYKMQAKGGDNYARGKAEALLAPYRAEADRMNTVEATKVANEQAMAKINAPIEAAKEKTRGEITKAKLDIRFKEHNQKARELAAERLQENQITSQEYQAEMDRIAASETAKADREARAGEGDKDRASKERIATGENATKIATSEFKPDTFGSTPLDSTTRDAILKEAGGDANKAREIARSRGYDLSKVL